MTAFLAGGHLEFTTNCSERACRTAASGRKAWIFCGRYARAQSAVEPMSLVASVKLQGLDPARYLCGVLRALSQWPRERFVAGVGEQCPVPPQA